MSATQNRGGGGRGGSSKAFFCSHSHDGVAGLFGGFFFLFGLPGCLTITLRQPAGRWLGSPYWFSFLGSLSFFLFFVSAPLPVSPSDPPVHPVNVVCQWRGVCVCGCLTPCHRFASAMPRHCLSFDIHSPPPRVLAPQRELQRHKSFFSFTSSLFFRIFFYFVLVCLALCLSFQGYPIRNHHQRSP